MKDFPRNGRIRVTCEMYYLSLYFQAQDGFKRNVKKMLRTGALQHTDFDFAVACEAVYALASDGRATIIAPSSASALDRTGM